MTNRKDELKTLLTSALNKPNGIFVSVSGDEPGRRQLAISALIAAKRELLPDVVELLNVTIKPNPQNENEIAIIHVRPGELIEV